MSLGTLNEYSMLTIYHRKCPEDKEKLSVAVSLFQVEPIAPSSLSHFHILVGISSERDFAPLLKETLFHFSPGPHSASPYIFSPPRTLEGKEM